MQNTSPHSTLRILQTPGPKGSNGDSLLENLEARVRVQQGLTQQDHAAVPQAVTAKVQTSQGFIFIKSRCYILTALRGQGAIPQPAKKHQPNAFKLIFCLLYCFCRTALPKYNN